MEKNTHTHTKIMGKKYVTNYRVKGEKTTRFFLYTYIREKSCAQYPTKLHRLHRRTLRFKVSLFLFLHHCRFSFLSSSYKLFLLYIYTDLYSFRSRIFPFFFHSHFLFVTIGRPHPRKKVRYFIICMRII